MATDADATAMDATADADAATNRHQDVIVAIIGLIATHTRNTSLMVVSS